MMFGKKPAPNPRLSKDKCPPPPPLPPRTVVSKKPAPNPRLSKDKCPLPPTPPLSPKTVVGESNGVVNINENEVQKDEKLLGKGEYALVFSGKWRGRQVALKICTNPDCNEKFQQEGEIMSKLEHHNVIQLFGIVTDAYKRILVIEYVDRGSLDNILKKENLGFDQLMSISIQIAEGIAHISSKWIIHRDLAVRNVLFDGKVAKIADFGLARQLDCKRSIYIMESSEKVPFRWYPIESLYRAEFTLKSDVWSFGMVLMELFTKGRTPYHDVDYLMELKLGYRIPKPCHMRKPLYSIIDSCWSSKPKERPSYTSLIKRLNNIKNTYFSNDSKLTLGSTIVHGEKYDVRHGVFNQTPVLVKMWFHSDCRKFFKKDFRIFLLLEELGIFTLLTSSPELTANYLIIKERDGRDCSDYLLLETFETADLMKTVTTILKNSKTWSPHPFGLLLIEMFFHIEKSDDQSDEDFYDSITKSLESGTFAKQKSCPRGVFEIIKLCVLNKEKYPSLEYLKEYFGAWKPTSFVSCLGIRR